MQKDESYKFDVNCTHIETSKTSSGTFTTSLPFNIVQRTTLSVYSESNGSNWKEKIRTDPIVVGYLVALSSRENYQPPLHRFSATRTDGVIDEYHCVTNYNATPKAVGSFPNDLLAPARAEAIGNFASDFRDATRAIDSFVQIGQIRETVDLIIKPAKKIQKIFTDWIKAIPRLTAKHAKAVAKKKGKVKSLRRFLADQWLQYSFGLKPLLQDAIQASNLLNERAPDWQHCWVVIKGKGKVDRQAFSPITGFEEFFSGRAISYTYTATFRAKTKLRGALFHDGSGPLANTSVLYGYDPSNIAPAVWELIPYSFLVDYFTNVGDIIDSWSVRNVYNGTEIMETVVAQSLSECKGFADRSTPPNPYVAVTGTMSEGMFQRKINNILRHNIGNVLPIAEFAWKIPGIESSRWINILALVQGKNK